MGNRKGLAPADRGSGLRRDAGSFLRARFDPGDRIGVVLIKMEGEEKGKVVQRFWSAEAAAGPRCQSFLRALNAQGWDVYCTANSLKAGAWRRNKEDVLEARWLYLDADEDGDKVVKRLDEDAARGRLPRPTAIVQTSPGRYQVMWRIRPTEPGKAEDMLRRLAIEYETDRAATDCNRVLRLPGFRSRKRGAPVQLVRYAEGPGYELEGFPQDLPDPEIRLAGRLPRPGAPNLGGGCSRSPGGDRTKSGQDWAWTRQQLRDHVLRRADPGTVPGDVLHDSA